MKKDMRYVSGIPKKPLPEGRVLVHNHVIPQAALGMNGFRAWTQTFDDRALVKCPCHWAGRDLHGLDHYRVRARLPEHIENAPQDVIEKHILNSEAIWEAHRTPDLWRFDVDAMQAAFEELYARETATSKVIK